MTTEEKIELLARTIEAVPGSLKSETVLDDLDYWDSLSKLSVLAMFGTHFDRELDLGVLRAFRTVGDILTEMHA